MLYSTNTSYEEKVKKDIKTEKINGTFYNVLKDKVFKFGRKKGSQHV